MVPIYLNEIPNEFNHYLGVIKDISFPRQGHTSDVGIIQSEHGKFVLKRTKGEQYSAWLSDEVHVLKSLSVAPLSTPKVYHFVEQKSEDQAWALMEFFEGETLRSILSNENNRDRKHELIYKFGKALSQIHSTPCPIALVKDGLWLDEMLRRAEINLQKYKVDGTENLLQFLKNNKPAPVENTLIHGDFTIDNVLVHEGEITSVIDWSGGALGDPRYDVCLAIRPKPNIFEEESEVHTFFEGYGKRSIGESEFHYFEKGLYAFF